MILYHTSDREIRDPDIHHGRRNADFGWGFYLCDTLGIISSGFLKPEDDIKLLMIGQEYTQVALKTEKAAGQLRWIGSERIERIARDDLKTEQDAFQEASIWGLRFVILSAVQKRRG